MAKNPKGKGDRFYTFFQWFKLLKMKLLWLFTYHKDHPVTVYKNINEIPKALSYGDKYLADPPRDPVYHPTLIQKRIDEGKLIGDCDDHAIYWCAALLKGKLAKRVWFTSYFWDGIEGHAICVFEGLDGNMYWGDYNNPTPVKVIGSDKVEKAFWWLESAMAAYGAKHVTTASMFECRRINKRDVPKLNRAHWIENVTRDEFQYPEKIATKIKS